MEFEQLVEGQDESTPQIERSHHAGRPLDLSGETRVNNSEPSVRVVVPEAPPVVTAPVARALLRLLVSVRHQRQQGRSTGGSSTDDEESS
ncbi:hypothetical protein ACIRL2_00005 [Embleya sp. NPDC127516]|uniref:hypothetical protein n=1 Tax=Embleya sp. NPDC127516 TaxID=3363990 RepID=UPI0037F935EC